MSKLAEEIDALFESAASSQAWKHLRDLENTVANQDDRGAAHALAGLVAMCATEASHMADRAIGGPSEGKPFKEAARALWGVNKKMMKAANRPRRVSPHPADE